MALGEFKREPDYEQFLKVLWRRDRPTHLPFYEHIASAGFIAERTGVPIDTMSRDDADYWPTYVDFWLGMGFDCVPMEVSLNCPMPDSHAGGASSHGSESRVVFTNRKDFETYDWPDESAPIDFHHFETVAKLLPDGAKIVGGVGAGPYEWASFMLGTIGMSYLLADDPELVGAVFERLGRLHHAAVAVLAQMDFVVALRQGDDLGFKTSTFLSPDLLRQHVLPTYTKMAAEAHAAGKPFILHSCGNLAAIYDDLIDTCKIDAKHSFENTILPVDQFKARYGHRITPLGGLDVDVICRGSEQQIRQYTRQTIEACYADGYWALGTGNSLTDYMPIANYLTVLDEGRKIA